MLSPPRSDESRVSSAGTGTARVPRTAVLLVATAAIVVLVYVQLAGNGWVYDDNLNLVLVQHYGSSWHWLTLTIFQHWGIAYRFVFSVIHHLMPIDYRWALAAMLGLLGASMYLLDRIVRLLFRGRWVGLLAAIYLGLSILFIRPLQWASDGLQHLPNTFFDLLCLYGYLRFVAERRTRWAVVAAGALAGGLLFFEKPAYMLLYLPAMRILFLAETFAPRRLVRAFWEERLVWGSMLAVLGVWAIGYLASGGGGGVSHGTVGLSAYFAFFRILWAQTLAPAAINLTLPNLGLSSGQVLLAIAIQLAVLALVAVSLVRKRSAWRAWLFLVFCVAITGILVARARIPQFGVGVGGDVRYLVDFTWLIPLSVVFAFASATWVWPAPRERRRNAGTTALRWPVALTSLVLVAGYAIAAVGSTGELQDQWAGPSGRAWETNLAGSLARFETGHVRPVVANAETPMFILEDTFAPYNRLEYIAPLYRPGTQVDGLLDGPLLTVDPGGVAHPSTVATVLDPGSVSQLVRHRQLTISGQARTRVGANGVCIQAGVAAAELRRTLAGTHGPGAGPYYLIASLSSPGPAAVPVYVDIGQGLPLATDRFIHAPGGASRSILFLGTPRPKRLLMTISPGQALCLRRLDVVTLRRVS